MPAAYKLQVLQDRIEIASSANDGLIQGVQTLRQLLANTRRVWTMPQIVIEDSPRLAWRGLMLDCSRTFLSL